MKTNLKIVYGWDSDFRTYFAFPEGSDGFCIAFAPIEIEAIEQCVQEVFNEEFDKYFYDGRIVLIEPINGSIL